MNSENKTPASIEVLQTPGFARKKKKLQQNEIADLDKAIAAIVKDPEKGSQKNGDLADIWVYKFKMQKKEHLLAYKWDEQRRILIALGVHENFYRDLKRSNKF